MQKEFNDTGLCIPSRHYMTDTSKKIEHIVTLVEKGKYFTINRPRQFGKTTTLSLLAKHLNQREDSIALSLSFEGIDTVTYQHQEEFIAVFLHMLIEEFEFLDMPDITQFIDQDLVQIHNMYTLSTFLTKLMKTAIPQQSLVLMIDEVDKSSNNQLFLDFLAMLRIKYLRKNEGKDWTFQSVILAGVHDVKTLKAKIRPNAEQKYNSPWNIAVDFTVDLSFKPDEIATMLRDYAQDKQIEMDISAIAQKLFYYTSGYPYLVSKLCKFIDETIGPAREEKNWFVGDVDSAFSMIVDESYTTTLFDSLTKNLENNQDLYANVLNIVINGKPVPFNINVPVINLGYLYGIFTHSQDGCTIHNRIYEQRIYNYLMAKTLTAESETIHSLQPEYYTEDGLNVSVILQKFQAFMKEQYSQKDAKFLEREGRLLFLSFLKPIINGKGFDFKEPAVSDERRTDLVITYHNKRYVIELKRWYGPKAHQKGLGQLSDYLNMYSLQQGYLLIYDFRKNKAYTQETITFQDKQIFAVWI